MPPAAAVPPGNDLGKYRLRAYAVMAAAILIPLNHGADLLLGEGANWPALAIRIAWGLLLLGNGLLLLRGARRSVLRVSVALSMWCSAACYALLLAATGGGHSPLRAFAPVLMILLPLIVPELLAAAVGASVATLAAVLALQVQAGESGWGLMPTVNAGGLAVAIGWAFAAMQRRAQLEAAGAEAAQREALRSNQRLVGELREALASVRTLRGLLPVCAWCRRVRDDQGYWNRLETYVAAHSEAEFSHGMCPDCFARQEAKEGAS